MLVLLTIKLLPLEEKKTKQKWGATIYPERHGEHGDGVFAQILKSRRDAATHC